MLFNSYAFIFLFLPITLIAFFLIGRHSTRYAAIWLAFASLVFYGYWNAMYVWLLLASISINFLLAQSIARHSATQGGIVSRTLFQLAVVANLLLLGYYKYSNFFALTVNELAGSHLSVSEVILPLGISFFTFTQIAFLADTYQGKVRDFSFLHYLLFITYFPHLIAGPILHHESVIPQFQRRETYTVNWNNLAAGIVLFAIGLFKKTFWADSLAPFADSFFSESYNGLATATLPTSYEAWAGALAYTLQIYFDFSGYTDMALGVALMFNTRLPINFHSPYKATSIIEFWRRWHISLSTFLRDYLYIPLGGSRHGKLKRYRNLLATMLIGGLWHGAGWTFLAWGGVHGLLLAINHIWRELPINRPLAPLPKWISGLIAGGFTFIAVVVTWVFFRSNNLSQACVVLQAMFGIASNPIPLASVVDGHLLVLTSLDGKELAQLILFGLAWVWLLPNSNGVEFRQGGNRLLFEQVAIVGLVLCLSINRFGSYSPFLYYQF